MSPLQRFVDKWCSVDYPPDSVSEDVLRQVAAELGVVFPKDYVHQLLTVGAPHAKIDLLDLIVDAGLDESDLSELATPSQVLNETLVWRKIGMPENLIVIGNDCMGNKFCFDVNELICPDDTESKVHYWDHDFDSTSTVAASFSEWMERLANLSAH